MAKKVFGVSLEKGLWGRLIYPLLSTLLVVVLIVAVVISLRFLLSVQDDILKGAPQGGTGVIESFNIEALKPLAPRLGIDPETLKPIEESSTPPAVVPEPPSESSVQPGTSQ